MHEFTVVSSVFEDDISSKTAFIRINATSPVAAIKAANIQIQQDHGPGASYMTLAVYDGWPRDYLAPEDDNPAQTGEWEKELDDFFLGGNYR